MEKKIFLNFFVKNGDILKIMKEKSNQAEFSKRTTTHAHNGPVKISRP
jgi:hypothetical protein